MTEIRFSAPHVLDKMKSVVNDEGENYVYPPAASGDVCFYRREGEPECLIGRILRALVPDYKPTEGRSVWDLRGDLYALGIDRAGVLCMQTAQAMQDQGHTWGAALAAARITRDTIRAWRVLD